MLAEFEHSLFFSLSPSLFTLPPVWMPTATKKRTWCLFDCLQSGISPNQQVSVIVLLGVGWRLLCGPVLRESRSWASWDLISHLSDLGCLVLSSTDWSLNSYFALFCIMITYWKVKLNTHPCKSNAHIILVGWGWFYVQGPDCMYMFVSCAPADGS